MAACYPSNAAIARQWSEIAAAAVHVSSALPAGQRVATQGHVMAIGDFLSTLAVEATIHHLDLAADGQMGGPSSEGLAVVRHTLVGVLGQPVPADWDHLCPERRRPDGFTAADHTRLGELAARFPLLG